MVCVRGQTYDFDELEVVSNSYSTTYNVCLMKM